MRFLLAALKRGFGPCAAPEALFLKRKTLGGAEGSLGGGGGGGEGILSSTLLIEEEEEEIVESGFVTACDSIVAADEAEGVVEEVDAVPAADEVEAEEGEELKRLHKGLKPEKSEDRLFEAAVFSLIKEDCHAS